MNFFRQKPQPRQFALRAEPLALVIETIAAQLPIKNDRSIEPILHMGQIALQSGPGNIQQLLQVSC